MIKFRCLQNILYIKQQVYRQFVSSSNVNSNGKYIFMNGCDKIFSQTLAVQLDKQGFNVFIGVYDLKSKYILKNQLSRRATIFPIDITRLEDINNAYDLIKQQTTSLHALINNVDISSINHFERNTMELMHKKMNVYFFGHVSITKTFLPLLTSKRNSSIVNICLVNNILDYPVQSTYATMKDGLKSFSDTIRRDMTPWNLRVSMIEADSIHTSMMMERHDEFWNKLSMDVQEGWDEDFRKIQMKQLVENRIHRTIEHPNKVVAEVHEYAVDNIKSRSHYRSGWPLNFGFFSVPITSGWFNGSMLQMRSISRLFKTLIQK
jgi:short-subunit dehydrogenase